jgi:hypothetical protein
MVRETTIKGRNYIIHWETSEGGESKSTQEKTIGYVTDPNITGYTQQPIDVNKVSYINPRGFAFVHYDKNDSNGPSESDRPTLGDDWVKMAIWLTDEEAKAAGACEKEEEKDAIEEGEEPLTTIGKCKIVTWDHIQRLLDEYKNTCISQSPKVVNEFLEYTVTGDDKTELETLKWGQLFGRVEYYSHDKLLYKKEVNDQFQNGITFFRKWGVKQNWNDQITWGDCFAVKGNYLEFAMRADQPGGHGAAMWHEDDKYAYKHHGTNTEYTNSEAWTWRVNQNVPNTQNTSPLGFTNHSPQAGGG